MNILILAAADRGNAVTEGGYPIWLAEVDGKLVLEQQVEALSRFENPRFIFLFQKADIESYYLNDIVTQLTKTGVVLPVRKQTAGAACTALLSADEINMDDELVVANATDQLNVDFKALTDNFRGRKAAAGVCTFPSLHPRYSYVRTDDEGWVVECAEKRPISRQANAGFYWFAKASDFFDALRSMILKDAHVQGKFYLCPALNELILRQYKVMATSLEPHQYFPLKTEDQLSVFGAGERVIL